MKLRCPIYIQESCQVDLFPSITSSVRPSKSVNPLVCLGFRHFSFAGLSSIAVKFFKILFMIFKINVSFFRCIFTSDVFWHLLSCVLCASDLFFDAFCHPMRFNISSARIPWLSVPLQIWLPFSFIINNRHRHDLPTSTLENLALSSSIIACHKTFAWKINVWMVHSF